jgi:hypothetical protein
MAGIFAARADDLARTQLDLDADLERLALGSSPSEVLLRLASASTELWIDSSYLRLLVDRAVASDGFVDGFVHGMPDTREVDRLRRLAGHRAGARGDRCPWSSAPPDSPSSPRFGDLGGTFGAEVRTPFFTVGATPDARGRSVVARALADASDVAQIRSDEFELVQLATDRYLVVLPGVTDLSPPHLGLDPVNRSVRDLDQHAYPSSRSTDVDHNRYAAIVWDALRARSVPPGADVMIVGHSFGADTALDLAADAAFNGPGGYHVTHVVAAGYYSDPQLVDVGPGTEVLVVQNSRDAVVIAEAIGHHHVTDSFESAGRAVSDLGSGDAGGALANGAATVFHGAGALFAGVRHAIGHTDDLVDVGVGIATRDPQRVRDGIAEVVTLDAGVREVTRDQLVDVFDGGADGVGHHPANYIDHLHAVADPRLTAFFASVDAGGYAAPGTSWAIDVSVPGS